MKKAKKIIAVFFSFFAFLFFPFSASALSLSVSVPERYLVVNPGDRFYFLVDVKYPENKNRKDLRLTYQIKKDQEIIAEIKSLRAVEAQMSFMDFVVVPESAKKGRYIINIKVEDYDKLSEEVSSSFEVKLKMDGRQMLLYVFNVLQAILFIAVLIAIFVFFLSKSKRK